SRGGAGWLKLSGIVRDRPAGRRPPRPPWPPPRPPPRRPAPAAQPRWRGRRAGSAQAPGALPFMAGSGSRSAAAPAITRSRISVAALRDTPNFVTSAFTGHGLPAASVARIDASAALSALDGTTTATCLPAG